MLIFFAFILALFSLVALLLFGMVKAKLTELSKQATEDIISMSEMAQEKMSWKMKDAAKTARDAELAFISDIKEYLDVKYPSATFRVLRIDNETLPQRRAFVSVTKTDANNVVKELSRITITNAMLNKLFTPVFRYWRERKKEVLPEIAEAMNAGQGSFSFKIPEKFRGIDEKKELLKLVKMDYDSAVINGRKITVYFED